jgi:hypothetical protein
MTHRYRWLRLVIPFGVVLLVILLTVVAHMAQSPDATDASYLSPTSSAADGGATLAGRLAAAGITVHRVTSSSDALVQAYRGDATLFLPTPGLMHPYYLRMLKLLPPGVRVVLVSPTSAALSAGHIPVESAATRWASKAVAPGCDLPEAVKAGRAAVYHTHYQADAAPSCYAGGLVGAPVGPAEVLLAGADDPFRNDRIGEHGNAALATGLLAAHPTVVWLDLHRAEQPPGVIGNGSSTAPVAPASLNGNGSPDPDFPLPGSAGGGGNVGGGGDNGASEPPLLTTVPPKVWAFLGLLLLALLALAFARGRRLGPPVVEPLPVVVRGAETVEGRGRLYHRAGARGPALDVLRAAARYRLLPALDLDPGASPSTVVSALAARTGRAPDEIDEVLYGPPPTDDAGLVRLSAALDALVRDTLSGGEPR